MITYEQVFHRVSRGYSALSLLLTFIHSVYHSATWLYLFFIYTTIYEPDLWSLCPLISPYDRVFKFQVVRCVHNLTSQFLFNQKHKHYKIIHFFLTHKNKSVKISKITTVTNTNAILTKIPITIIMKINSLKLT